MRTKIMVLWVVVAALIGLIVLAHHLRVGAEGRRSAPKPSSTADVEPADAEARRDPGVGAAESPVALPPSAVSATPPDLLDRPPPKIDSPVARMTPAGVDPSQVDAAACNVEVAGDLIRSQALAIQQSGEPQAERVSALLASGDPIDQAAGLAAAAGLRRLDAAGDFTRFPPETVLAAVDAGRDVYGPAAASALLARWADAMGGRKAAGETAHTGLLEARLAYGGGSAALALMQEVNEPAAILVGLRGFAVDPDLDSTTRLEALVLLRDHMAFEDYQDFVRFAAARAREESGVWSQRVERLLERVDGPPPVMSAPLTLDAEFVRTVFSRPYPAMVRDLEIYLRHQSAAGRLRVDGRGPAALIRALDEADASGISVLEQCATLSLRRLADRWTSESP